MSIGHTNARGKAAIITAKIMSASEEQLDEWFKEIERLMRVDKLSLCDALVKVFCGHDG